jgi:hypothetical protein
MILVLLLIPAAISGLAAVALAAFAGRRIAALDGAGEGPRRAGGSLSLAAAGAVGLGALLLALPVLYLVYLIAFGPSFD